ncbi:nitrite reductase [Comamonas terrigena]|uniref:nitrite reductase n=1 Tax=Comamonas terrigena TaxID=32013 RepID=UPI002447FEC7|nr:nitrite reductase [Comamonas terrigena]MDH0049544.1 nitrite reductase [Comamonas terrigena]MDH0512179.1 nitrite reductase [Comamonas terrigena]MDH1091706.1 nitrite reductase [Comamonas terrigena]MDH1501519.1 nitrite reductase [Comamonas terrigena]
MADSIKVQGWCPTAWKPMRSEDGWIVRVRPVCASINAAQWAALAALALSLAHPQIELTRLGNVQLRGVADADLPALLSQLVAARLIPADADADLAPPVHCTPFYEAHDRTHQLAALLGRAVVERLCPSALERQDMAALPSKFGLLVDDAARSLGGVASDLRVWADADGGYGLALGEAGDWYRFGDVQQLVDAAIHIAAWFARARMAVSGKPPTRLQALLPSLPLETPALRAAVPQGAQPPAAAPVLPGQLAQGWVLGAPLGRIDALAMQALAASLPADTEIRVTPWRSLLLMSADAPARVARLDARHWMTDAADARLRVSACTGSPRCAQAHVPAQDMALQLAPHVPERGHLHVSGCAKFCALSSDATSLIFASTSAPDAVWLHAGAAGQPGCPTVRLPYRAGSALPAELPTLLHDLPL